MKAGPGWGRFCAGEQRSSGDSPWESLHRRQYGPAGWQEPIHRAERGGGGEWASLGNAVQSVQSRLSVGR